MSTNERWQVPSAQAVQNPAWRRMVSSVIHRCRWFEVRCDTVVQPDGQVGVYHHVLAPGSVTVLAIDAGWVLLTRQWIYTHGGTQWRLPSGGIDPGDADPLAAARRELAEETGFVASSWVSAGRVHGADSWSNHVDHVFVATGLTEGLAHLGGGEADLRLEWLPFQDAVDLVLAGDIPHAGSAYALLAHAARIAEGQPADQRQVSRRFLDGKRETASVPAELMKS
jgi:8-oxo-dGTP pyrophosphatase MutT (NUDIX family)